MKLITIATYDHPNQMYIHKSKLESHGIRCFTKDELIAQVYSFRSQTFGGVQLQVMEKDVEAALNILKQEFDFKADYSNAPYQCPNCGSGNIGGKGITGKIALTILVFFGVPYSPASSKIHCYDCGQDHKAKEIKQA